MHSLGQVVVLLGPPGSGKGTQSALLASRIGIPEISTGAILRRECQSGTELGNVIQNLLAAGQLVPDGLVNRVIANRLRLPDCQNGCILDGYPRTVSQARFLHGLLAQLNLAPPVAFHFQLDSDEIVARLSRRYNCGVCGRSFAIKNEASSAALVCEHDGSPLFRRADDNPASIRERLRIYEANGTSLVKYYRRRKAYHAVSASRPVAEISRRLSGILDGELTPVLKGSTVRIAALPELSSKSVSALFPNRSNLC